MEAVACYSVSHRYTLLSTYLYLQVFIAASGFCDTINIGSSPRLLPLILLLPSVTEILPL
ncbi:hypothetical protein T10_8072 [Trichinella papuae]|uniref:Uncharacterized protein n=1 Tax=Trichinella papuae TaxID=268474 RepID=A0A0V1LYF3_9BILA|nr:hypothetical protein T10_8072 [Trichinella papuae]